MALGTPYTIVSGSQLSNVSATLQVTVTATSAAGDAIVVAASSNVHADTVTSVTDSQGNTYIPLGSDYNQSVRIAAYAALNSVPLVSGVDWIAATFTTSTGGHALNGRGCSGVAAVNALDQSVAGDADGTTAMSAGPTNGLEPVSEWALAFVINGNVGGAPASWTGGFTARDTAHATNNQYHTVADQLPASTAALTAGATVLSTKWAMLLVTLTAGTAPVYPLTAEIRSPLPPAHPRAGRTASSRGSVVNNTLPNSGPRVYPLHQPVRFHPTLPPRGRTTGNRGAPLRNPAVGPPFRQAHQPVRGVIPRTFSQGRCRFSSATMAAQNLTTGPKFYPRRSPVKAQLGQIPLLWGRAATMSLLPGPVNPTTPTVGPQVYPLRRPVTARTPLHPRAGRTAGSRGAPVHNPMFSATGGDLFLLFP